MDKKRYRWEWHQRHVARYDQDWRRAEIILDDWWQNGMALGYELEEVEEDLHGGIKELEEPLRSLAILGLDALRKDATHNPL